MKTKMVLAFLLLLALCVLLCSCVNPYVMLNHPFVQKGTTWRTEDGKIQFSVPEERENEESSLEIIKGLYFSDTGKTVFYMQGSSSTPMIGLKIEGEDGEPQIEADLWEIVSLKKKEFTVRVSWPYIFEEGQIITFYRAEYGTGDG